MSTRVEFWTRKYLILVLILILKLWNFVHQKQLGIGNFVSLHLIKYQLKYLHKYHSNKNALLLHIFIPHMYGADCLSGECRYLTSEFQYSLQEIRVIIATQRIIVRIQLRHIVKGVNTVLYIKSTLINMLPLSPTSLLHRRSKIYETSENLIKL